MLTLYITFTSIFSVLNPGILILVFDLSWWSLLVGFLCFCLRGTGGVILSIAFIVGMWFLDDEPLFIRVLFWIGFVVEVILGFAIPLLCAIFQVARSRK